MLSKKFLSVAGASEPTDDYFENVTMLLHGDGTNGAQNNTFVDSSSQALTVGRNGNPTQGTFSPYGSNWSVLFKSEELAYFSPQTYFEFASGSNTIEFWFYPTVSGVSYNILIANPYGVSDSTKWGINITSSGYVQLYKAQSGPAFTSTNTINWNQWNHVALVTDISAGNTNASISFYINGSRTLQTGCDLSSYTYCGQNIHFSDRGGDPYSTTYDNWMSNFRWVRSASVYTGSTITVPTAPLTAIANTKLLTLQSNRFIDNSGSNLTIYHDGYCSVQRFSPFSPTLAYSTSTINGSVYLDGSGDYLLLSNVASQTYLGGGDWTLECWVYYATNQNSIFVSSGQGSAGYNHQFTLSADSSTGTVSFGFNQGNGGPTATATGFKPKCWNHVAIVRNYSSNNIVVYVNGVGTTTTGVSGAGNNVGYYYEIGQYFMGSYLLNGYISNLRQVTGVAVYSGNFTPPTAPLATSGAASAASYPSTTNVNTTFAASATQLLVNGDNAGIIDNAMMNDLETVGNAQISTSVKKYGTGSLAFDGNGDYLQLQTNPALSLSGDFTIEFWVYANSSSSNSQTIWCPSAIDRSIQVNSTSSYWVYWDGAAERNFGAFTSGTWAHIALARSGTTVKGFLNGVQGFSITDSGTLTFSAGAIGYRQRTTAGNYFNGYIDDFRITNGYARYTSNFTTPSAALPDK